MIKKKTRSKLGYRPLLLSRHPSHQILRTELDRNPFRAVVRLGSTTIPSDGKERLQINTAYAVRNSADKLLMKECFDEAAVKTAKWWRAECLHEIEDNSFPIIAKHRFGSRNSGNTLLNNSEELSNFLLYLDNTGKTKSNYIFEKFYTYSKEYRIHVTNDGCFYTCRKLLRNDTPDNEQWHRHDDNSVWIVEDNPKFKKPHNWDSIVEDCVNAKKALGLDICAFDVKTQGSSKERPKWIIIESCSAPSFGEITTQKYIKELNKLIKNKYYGI
jgi:glutathione synthase/RimK-type ligase-like ATP-grasp enzyme